MESQPQKAQRVIALLRAVGGSIVNLWISSLIPPSLISGMRGWTVVLAHRLLAAVFLMATGAPSARIIPSISPRVAIAPTTTSIEKVPGARQVSEVYSDEAYWVDP